MAGYIFEHEGRQYTPDGVVEVPSTAAHNRQLAEAELARWAQKPDRQLAYYHIPISQPTPELRAKGYGECRHTTGATVTLWTGEVIGRITYQTVYRHNFGGRMVSLRVRGTNGADYYGRASWDNGTCIYLRRCKP